MMDGQREFLNSLLMQLGPTETIDLMETLNERLESLSLQAALQVEAIKDNLQKIRGMLA